MKWKDINVQFGNILRKVREGRKMTQEEFAEFCGISRAYYGRIERGEHSVTLELCQKVSEATGLSFAELFEDIVWTSKLACKKQNRTASGLSYHRRCGSICTFYFYFWVRYTDGAEQTYTEKGAIWLEE